MIKKLLVVALVISILLNVIVIYSSIIKTERLNTSWYRLTLNFANFIHYANTTVIASEDGISSQYQNLKNIQQELGNLQLLPEGSVIIGDGPDGTLTKSEALLQVQFNVLAKMKQELKQTGKISDATNQEYTKVEQRWDAVSKSFRNQLKTVNPFAYTFNANRWKTIFETAFSAKDSVQ